MAISPYFEGWGPETARFSRCRDESAIAPDFERMEPRDPLEVCICGQQDKLVSDAELSEQGFDFT